MSKYSPPPPNPYGPGPVEQGPSRVFQCIGCNALIVATDGVAPGKLVLAGDQRWSCPYCGSRMWRPVLPQLPPEVAVS